MRKCKATIYVRENNQYVPKIYEDGLFHCWGNMYEEFENGPGNYSVGIVELSNGRIILPTPNNIEFISDEEAVEP